MSKGGVLNVLANIHTLKVEHYLARKEWFRFLLEIVYLVALIFDVLNEMLEFLATTKKTKNILAYFHKFWNIIDLASVGIMVTGAILWYVPFILKFFKANFPHELYLVYSGSLVLLVWLRNSKCIQLMKFMKAQLQLLTIGC